MISLSAFDLTPSRSYCHEWLMANGIGGYSSSTTIGMNSRKYHGLLIAPLKGEGARHVMFSKLEETATVDGEEFQLSTNAYPGVSHPEGFRQQVGFEFSSHPMFAYSLGGNRLEKSVRLLHGKNAVVISYRIVRGGTAELLLRPLLCPRPIHADPTQADKWLVFSADRSGFDIDSPAHMRVCASHGRFSPSPLNYRNVVYRLEAERGYPATETLFSPGVFVAKISQGEELHICASLEGMPPSEALDLLDRQGARRAHLLGQFSQSSGIERTDFSDRLCIASDSFCLVGEGRCGIIAGYPWFSQWGRDAMISLPGLLLSTGRFPLAREILLSHAKMMEDGLIPNFMDDNGQPSFNSADASLWFVDAVRQYAEATGDYAFVRDSLWKHIRAFLSSYIHGNSAVRMDDDCLLRTLSPASTWMDAQVGGHAITPRKGKPVEINALWHSDLCFIRELAQKFGDRRTESVVSPIIEGSAQSFQKFLSAGEGGLFDVIEPADPSVRPNQIFAVSLPHSPLNHIQQKHVFNIVRGFLYTPLGLHTLSPRDARFCNSYSGSPEDRDAAYHQGMIWPWLLGAFYDAQLRVYPGSEKQILASLKPLADSMVHGCVGSLPEMYEPKSGKAAGAPSQAWSVAEALRIYTKVKRSAQSPEGRIAMPRGATVFSRA
ncbi:MAG: amylo-alpha-1,6-glucosidase [Candidatus Micrarchaeia archaeon]